jgi:hypothetical protein
MKERFVDPYKESQRLEDELESAVDEVKKYPGHHPGLSLAENVHEMVKDLAHERDEWAALREQNIAENHAIMTLTGPPRVGYSLQQEIRAQLEETQTERGELRAEVERLKEMNAGHPTMCCGQCARQIREAKAEVERLRTDSLSSAPPYYRHWQEEKAKREKAEAALRELWQWSDPMDLPRFVVELVRAAPSGTALEKHEKHPTGDYCIYCRAQWPCEEAEPKGGA